MSSPLPGPLVLALHSSSETLGLALGSLASEAEPARIAAFPLGRGLSNQLLTCLESLLPAGEWGRLGRLAVATGPGGFTGTRLTIVLARTLAQQLALPLDGFSSFRLMARRLHRTGAAPGEAPFWLVQELPRHGLVAGLYAADPAAVGGISERLAPRLFPHDADLEAEALRAGAAASDAQRLSHRSAPRLAAQPRLPEDAAELLAFSRAAAHRGDGAPWQSVVPLYPTSPVGAGS